MTLRKLTQWFFYLLGVAAVGAIAYFIIPGIVRNWDKVSDIFIALGITGLEFVLFLLFMWAFIWTDDNK